MIFTLRCQSIHDNRPELSFVTLKFNKKAYHRERLFLEEWLLKTPVSKF